MITIEEAIEKFKTELPEEVQEICGEDEVIKAVEELETKYAVGLSQLVIFFAVGEADNEDLVVYCENELGLDQKTSQDIANDFEEKIFKPLVERINFINESTEKTMGIEQEKSYADNIIKKHLLSELQHAEPVIEAINRRFFYIFSHDPSFQHRLEQSLYENEELLGKDSIVVDGQEMKPTIGNWIKDFISRFGSQAYDSVSMSAFLINSENVKKLSDEDHKKLAKIIKLYGNLKFFPQSMPSDDGSGWQILPIETMNDQGAMAEAMPQKQTAAALEENEQPRSPVPSVENAELLELKNMLLQYPAGSLERAAIEEEIKHLEEK